jgi:hypothetical protein
MGCGKPSLHQEPTVVKKHDTDIVNPSKRYRSFRK